MTAAVLSAVALAAGCAEPPTVDTRPRNVLLIVVDTLRADRLGAYGFTEATSPNLDALAHRGVRLEQFRTAAPSTLASFTSMLTGLYPHTHGVYRNGVAWPDELVGVQSTFQAAGYTTAGFVASYCLTSRFGIARGFDHFDENLTIAMDELPQNKLIRRGEEVTDAVSAWLGDAAGASEPFFAMVHYFDPHWPYDPPRPYDAMFDADYRGPITGSMADVRALRNRLTVDGGRPDADSRHLHALHLGEIRYTDRQIGRLLSRIEELDLAERTLVVVTADHGETFWDHYDYFSHGVTVYDSNIRIPWIAAGPGIEGRNRVVEIPLSSTDLAPTLVEYAGLDVPEHYEGASFLSLLTDPADSSEKRPPLDVFSEATRPIVVEPGQAWPNRLKARCLVRGERKFVVTPWRGRLYELFDLRGDPMETTNLWGSVPVSESGDGERMAAGLEEWSDGAVTVATPDRQLDPEVIERLRSLGYVQ